MTRTCPSCGHENDAGAEVCAVCAGPLPGADAAQDGAGEEDDTGPVTLPAARARLDDVELDPPPPPPPPAAPTSAEPRSAEPPSEAPPSEEPPTRPSILLPEARVATLATDAKELDDTRSEPARPAEPTRAAVAPTPAAAASPPPDDASPVATAEEQRLAEYVADGYEVFLIAGIAAAGKTQLLDAYRQDGYLATVHKRGGRSLPTAPERLNAHPVKVGRRKVLFVDTSGENFKNLYPHLATTGEIQPRQVEFLRLVSRNLGGVVLLVDLAALWAAGEARPEERQQVAILAWVLELLRWLRFRGAMPAAESRIRFQDHVDAEVRRLRQRLEVPVLALFSKADELAEVDVPRPGGEWLHRGARQGPGGERPRRLFPPGESPLLLAYHRLPELYRALAEHAEHFRFDFVHSLVLDPDSGAVEDATPCGVSLSVRWLLDRSWQRRLPLVGRLPAVPTRHWVAVQRGVDRLTGRGERWRRLPEPLDVDLA